MLKFSLVSIVCFLLVFQCAHQGAPSGGPPDDTPPVIIKLKPAHLATNVDSNTVLYIKWSEWMNRESLENGLLFNPQGIGNPHYSWKGSSVKISFDSSFNSNTTYLISMSGSITDIHGKALEKPVVWAFSTGKNLSRGSIAAKIQTDNRSNTTLIAAYKVSTDTAIMPYSRVPDYLISAGSNKILRFEYLNSGHYRIFAFKDRNGDQKYQLGREKLAIPPYDCETVEDTSNNTSPVVLHPVDYDTSGPALMSVKAVNARILKLEFSKEIPLAQIRKKGVFKIYTVSDSVHEPLKIAAGSHGLNNREIFLVTNYQKHFRQYKIEVNGLTNIFGDTISSSADTALFFSNTLRDTVMPEIASVFPANGQRDILPDDSIAINFSEPVNIRYFVRGFKLLDSTGQKIKVRYKNTDLMHITIYPAVPWMQYYQYTLEIYPGSIIDIYRNQNRDTLTYRFTTAKTDDLTRDISGNIFSDDTGNTILTWKHLGTKRVFRYCIKGNSYKLGKMLKGKYLMSGFKDRNNNNFFDAGRLKPFCFSEQTAVYPDTLVLRGRWEVEGIDLNFGR